MSTSPTLSAAIHRHFETSGELAAALSGGLWTGEVPEGTPPPYGWLDVARVVSTPTLEQEFEAARVVVHLYAVGAAAAEQLALLFKARFDYKALTYLPSTSHAVVQVMPRDYRLVCEMARYKDSSLMYRAQLSYHILVQKDR